MRKGKHPARLFTLMAGGIGVFAIVTKGISISKIKEEKVDEI